MTIAVVEKCAEPAKRKSLAAELLKMQSEFGIFDAGAGKSKLTEKAEVFEGVEVSTVESPLNWVTNKPAAEALDRLVGNPIKTYYGVVEDKYLLTSGKNADDRFHQLVTLVKKGGGDLLASPHIKSFPSDFPAEVNGFFVVSPGPLIEVFSSLMAGPAGEPAPAPPPISGALGGYVLAKGNAISLEVFVPMEVVLGIKDALSGANMGAGGMPPQPPGQPRPGGAPQPAPAPAPAPKPAAPAPQ